MTALSVAVGWALIHSTWQTCAIALLIAALFRLTARRSANTRYAIACAGLIAMLIAPVMTVRLSWSADAAAWTSRRASVTSDAWWGTRVPGAVLETRPGPAGIDRVHDARPGPRAAGVSLLDRAAPSISIAWLLGVVFLLTRMAGGWYQVNRLHRDALAMDASQWQAACRRLAFRLGLPAAAHVVESAAVDVPMVVGWLRPAILLPICALAQLSPSQCDAILAHELAHIRRHDYLVNAVQTVVEILLFYHPAAWWLSERIRIEREHCCDDVAVAMCGDAVAYAEALATLEGWRAHRGAGAPGAMTSGTLAMAATGGSLLQRVRRILSAPVTPASSRGAGSWAATLALTALFTAAAGGVQHLPWTAGRTGSAAVEARVSPPTPPEPPTPPVPPTPPTPPAPPVPAPGGFSWSGDRGFRMSWSDGLTHIEVRLQGSVVFTDDLTDVQSLSDGGQLTIRDWSSLIPRTIEIQSAHGELTKRYYVAGLSRGWDSDAQRRLSEALPWLVRRSGLGAESRVRSIFSRSSVRGVLDEIGLLEGDYARRLYFAALIDVARPDAAAIVPILTQVGDRMRSDYERSQVLRQVADKVTLDERAAGAYVGVVNAMRSDYERRRALTALLATRPLSREIAGLAMRSAASMRSDYERGEVLRTALSLPAAAGAPGGDDRGDALLTAVGGMRSAYEKRRVLVEYLGHGTLTADTKKGVLMASTGIESDYERGQVLDEYLRRFGVESSARQPFFAALNTMRSDYDKRRLLTTVAVKSGADPLNQRAAFDAIGLMRSDHERAESLLAFINVGAVDASNRPALLRTAEQMRSAYDRNLVLATLVRSEQR